MAWLRLGTSQDSVSGSSASLWSCIFIFFVSNVPLGSISLCQDPVDGERCVNKSIPSVRKAG
jgi:hypothetical protein